MLTKKLFLNFPYSVMEKPVIYHLVKDYNLMVNIFRAKVSPEEHGYLVIDISGEEKDISAAILFLGTFNIEINETDKGLRWEPTRCTDCGNCITHCPTRALNVCDRSSMKVEFNDNLCIHCLSCIKNCPFGAVSSVF